MGKPAYLRDCAGVGGRLRDLLDLDDVAHEADGRGVLTEIDRAELDAVVARAKREIRENRRQWEMQTRAA